MTAKQSIQPDPWLSRILGRPAFNIKIHEAFEPQELSAFQKDHQGIRLFAAVKIAVDDLPHVHLFEENGFSLIDTNIVFEKAVETAEIKIKKNIQIDFAREQDRQDICQLASENFVFSRFHLDSQIPDSIANTIKGQWAENFFVGKRGDHMIVARREDRVVGFLQLLYSGDDMVIDLIAVSAKARKCGIASDMIQFAQNECGQNKKRFRVGTQAANVPSVRVYESCGFRYTGAGYVLHCHGWT